MSSAVAPVFADVIFRISPLDIVFIVVLFIAVPWIAAVWAVRRRSRLGAFLAGVLGSAGGAALLAGLYVGTAALVGGRAAEVMMSGQRPDGMDVLAGAAATGFFALVPGVIAGVISVCLWRGTLE